MPDDVVVAEPSAAEPQQNVLASLTPESRAEWRKTGKLPEPTKTQESSPADPPKEASTEKHPEAESGKEAQEQHGREERRAPGAEKRIQELIAENKRLKEQFESKSRTESKPEPAKETAKADDYQPFDEAKYMADHPNASFEEIIRAEAKHIAQAEAKQAMKAEREALKKAEQEAKAKEAAEEFRKSWSKRVEEAKKKHADFEELAYDKTLPLLQDSPADLFIADSEIGPEMLYYFGANRAELERINALPPVKQARELVKLEEKLSGNSQAVAVPAPQVTRAPKPAPEVGGRATTPEDEAAAAAKDGNFRNFKAKRDSEDMKRRLGR